MPYTNPKTWSTGDVATSADFDTYIRDNSNAIFPSGTDDTTSFTPVLTASTTNPTMGTSGNIAFGTYKQVGKLCFVEFRLKFGTVGPAAGSGTYRVSLPVNANANTNTNVMRAAGGLLFDSSAGTNRLCTFLITTTVATINYDNVTTSVTDALPWIWAASDEILGSFWYHTV